MDYALAAAVQTIEDYTDENGLLIWEREDENVDYNANRKVNAFLAARDAVTQTPNYVPVPGEYFVPEMIYIGPPGGRVQTFREWVMKQVESETDKLEE